MSTIPNAVSNADPAPFEDPLRFAFVEMLFALAVSQVAVYAADLVTVDESWPHRASAIGHLFLALMVIAASWLGWRQSVSGGMKERVQHLFTLGFVGLMFDVVLVILYFILVRSVELVVFDNRVNLGPPSAVPESIWVTSIFAVYAVWDVLADVCVTGAIPQGPIPKRILKTIGTVVVSTGASVICAVLAYLVFVVAHSVSASATEVLLLDGALVSLVLLFRAIKIYEHPVAKLLCVTDCNGFAQPRKASGREPGWAFALTLTYVLCVTLAYRWTA